MQELGLVRQAGSNEMSAFLDALHYKKYAYILKYSHENKIFGQQVHFTKAIINKSCSKQMCKIIARMQFLPNFVSSDPIIIFSNKK